MIGMTTVELSLKTAQMRNQRNYIVKVLKAEKQLEFHIQRKYIFFFQENNIRELAASIPMLHET